jgi:hypothetical protein
MTTFQKEKEVQKLGIYVGLKEKEKPEIFESDTEPTKETHPKYGIIYGPFKTTKDAENYVNAMDRGVACGEG